MFRVFESQVGPTFSKGELGGGQTAPATALCLPVGRFHSTFRSVERFLSPLIPPAQDTSQTSGFKYSLIFKEMVL